MRVLSFLMHIFLWPIRKFALPIRKERMQLVEILWLLAGVASIGIALYLLTTAKLSYPREIVDNGSIPLTIASVSASFAAIAAVFLSFASQQHRQSFQDANEQGNVRLLQRHLFRVTRINGLWSISVLLLNSVCTVLALTLGPSFVSKALLSRASLAMLTLGLFCFLFQMFTLVAQEGGLDLGDEIPTNPEQLKAGMSWGIYIRFVVTGMVVEILLVLVSLFFLLPPDPILFLDFQVTFLLPVMGATAVTLSSSKPYHDAWLELFVFKTDQMASLGLVLDNKDHVLMNRQKRQPFHGMWLLPGGYQNKDKGDETLRHTAERRLVTLLLEGTQTALNRNSVHAKEEVASPRHINGEYDPSYVKAVTQYGLGVTNLKVYRMFCKDGNSWRRFTENDFDIHESRDLCWATLADIKAGIIRGSSIPEHIRDLLLSLLTPNKHHSQMWDIKD